MTQSLVEFQFSELLAYTQLYLSYSPTISDSIVKLAHYLYKLITNIYQEVSIFVCYTCFTSVCCRYQVVLWGTEAVNGKVIILYRLKL